MPCLMNTAAVSSVKLHLKGRDVNTLIFPNLSAANTAYRMMLELGVAETIGPIQIGLNKPIHFIAVDSEVRDIINLTTIAVLDAVVLEKSGGKMQDK